MKTKPTTGLLIRQARFEAELTQEQLAELADVDQSKLSKYERGEQLPSIATMRRIAVALNQKHWWELYA